MRHLFIPLSLAIALAGCQATTPLTTTVPTSAASTEAAAPTPAPTATPAVSPVPTASPVATAPPSPMPTPTATPKPTGGGSSGGGGSAPTPTPAPLATATPVPDLPANAFLYVLNGLGKTIDEVDLSDNSVAMSILTTGLYPNQLLRDGDVTWSVNSGDHTIDQLDLLAPAKTDTIPMANGSNPLTMYKLTASTAIVVNYLNSDGDLRPDVAVLDLATKAVTKIIKLPNGQPAGGVAIYGDKIYIPATQADYSNWPAIGYSFSGVHVVDRLTLTVTKTIALADDANPGDITIDPTGHIVVAHKGGLSLIDPLTDLVTPGLSSPVPLHAIRFVSGRKAYAAVAEGLVSFDPQTQTCIKGPEAAIAAGGDTSVGGFEIRGTRAYVPNFANDTITVLDLETDAIVGAPIAVGDGPQAVVFQAKPTP
jgi:hypothetical protein